MGSNSAALSKTKFGESDIRARLQRFNIQNVQRQPWQQGAIDKITRFVNFEPNWDGYGAPPLDRQIGMFALEALQSVMQANTPLPALVPTSVGGIQIEWHLNGIDLEIHITAPYQAEVMYADNGTGDIREFEVTDDFQKLGELITLMPAA